MIIKPQSTCFKSVLDNEQVFNNLDHLKMNDYERFLQVGETGKEIQAMAKADDVEKLKQIIDKHYYDISFMKLQIEDAFITAFNLRNEQTVAYFLQNGIDIDQVVPDSVLSVCYSLEYLAFDPPAHLLRLILSYGANPRAAEQEQSDTPLHIASRYGNLEFVKILLEYGADINAINDQRMTPLGCAMAEKKKSVIEYLKSKNANSKLVI